MSDDLMGSLTKMAEQQAVEKLGLGGIAQNLGMGSPDELIAKATSLFGGHAPEAQSEAEAPAETESEPAEEPAEAGEPTEATESEDA